MPRIKRRPPSSVAVATLLFALGGCAATPVGPVEADPVPARPGDAGFATILGAPPSPVRAALLPGGEGPRWEELGNPDGAATRDAMALDHRIQAEAGGDYVGMRIVRDPSPRFAFQFRRDAAATLARFTRDPRFVAIDGGVPRAELQHLFDEWWARFQPHRILGAGSVMEFDGVVALEMTIDRAGFDAIATREGWVIPDRVRLNFPPPPNPRSVDPALASRIRVFAREDRRPAGVLQAALSGRLIVRDGCFRLRDHGEGEPLVLFGRDVELRLDDEGHMALFDPQQGRLARIGERVIWSGPRGVDPADAGVQALRAACGPDPIVAVGEPVGEQRFNAQAAAARAR